MRLDDMPVDPQTLDSAIGARSRSPAATLSPGLLLALITACLMLQPLSTDLYLASLPHLARYFEASPAAVQQTLSLFVIGFGTAQLVAGPLSDRFGRRPVLLGGLALYVAASVACAVAPSIAALSAARFVQAIGCCTAVVIARAVIRDVYSPAEGGRVVAQASSWMGLAPLLGPVVGAYLQVAFGWRAAFVVLASAGLAVAIATVVKMSETNAYRDPDAMRPGGLVRGYREILGAPVFWAYALPGALSFASIFVFISGASYVLINVLDVPTAYFGYAWGLGVTGYLAGAMLCRKLLATIGVDRALSLGTALGAVAGVLFAAAVALGFHHWATVVFGHFVISFAHGINWPCAQTGAVAPFPRRAGAAAGMLGFIVMMAGLFVGVVVAASHNGTLGPMAMISASLGLALLASARLGRPATGRDGDPGGSV
ncbi:multidrug effflux MFS transporter [Aromatoleum sp.]|uniref:multidrug effflux MFS transporter n=1 Tax=Aromatoleum sp. TaxID=2307007 RepID=UPI002FC5CD50